MSERIVFITAQFPFGRREAFLAAEQQTLTTLAADVTIVAVRPQATQPIRATHARAVALRTFTVPSIFDALRTLRKQPRDVLEVVTAMCTARYRLTAKLKNLAVLGKALALTEYVRRERISHIHAHWLTTPSTVACIAARLTRIPWSVSAHRFDLFADNWLAAKVAAASAVRVISERGAQDLRERTPPAVWNKIHVVHLGVQLPPRVDRPEAHGGPLRIAAVGSLDTVKGHCDLIEAIARLREAGVAVECAIAGDGPLRDQLQKQIERLGLAHIVALRGFVSHARLMHELAGGAVDVIAHPSIEDGNLHEGIPVSLMEAMACGVPCVASRTGSIPELVDPSCGMLVEQRDPPSLARALATLAGDPGLRAELGRAARQRIETHFDVSKTSAALLDLMQAARERHELSR